MNEGDSDGDKDIPSNKRSNKPKKIENAEQQSQSPSSFGKNENPSNKSPFPLPRFGSLSSSQHQIIGISLPPLVKGGQMTLPPILLLLLPSSLLHSYFILLFFFFPAANFFF